MIEEHYLEFTAISSITEARKIVLNAVICGYTIRSKSQLDAIE